MRGLANAGRHDVDVDDEEPARVDRADDGFDQRLAVTVGDGVHRVLHPVGTLLVDALELHRVQRRLVVVAGPDVVDCALAVDEELVDVRRGPADMTVAGPHVTLLVAAETHHAASGPPDISGRQREVHQRSVGAVVVVAPDQALLVGEHGPPARSIAFGFGDPPCRCLDVLDREPGNLRRLFKARPVALHCIVVGRERRRLAAGRGLARQHLRLVAARLGLGRRGVGVNEVPVLQPWSAMWVRSAFISTMSVPGFTGRWSTFSGPASISQALTLTVRRGSTRTMRAGGAPRPATPHASSPSRCRAGSGSSG